MSYAAIKFSLTERRKIHHVFARYLGMDLRWRTIYMREMEKDGWMRVFGYGSLRLDPHTPPAQQVSGFIPGYQSGAFLHDRWYRGSGRRNKLGVTLGIRSTGNPRNRLRGVVQGTRLDNGSNDVVESVMMFTARESSFNPIYRYEPMWVQTRLGRFMALVCATDEKSEQFIADRLTMQESAAIIASSFGEPKASLRNTGLIYFQFVLDGIYKAGEDPEPGIKRRVSMANAYRRVLPGDLQSHLEGLENIPERATYDPRVFELDREALRATPEEVAAILHSAQQKLNHGDPLSSQSLRKITRDMKKIKETLFMMKKIKKPRRILQTRHELRLH